MRLSRRGYEKVGYGYYLLGPSGLPSFAPPVILVCPYTTIQVLFVSSSLSPVGIPINICAMVIVRLGVMLAGHARMSRLITQHAKVRATVKDDCQGKDIVNVLCNVCRDGTIDSRGYSTISVSREHRAK